MRKGLQHSSAWNHCAGSHDEKAVSMAFSAFDHHGLVAGPPTEQIDCLCGCGNRATVGGEVKKVDQGAEMHSI